MQVLETQDAVSPGGRRLKIKVVRSRSRDSGRRILVEENGHQIYDTDDCHDLANAVNKLDHWYAKELAAPPAS